MSKTNKIIFLIFLLSLNFVIKTLQNETKKILEGVVIVSSLLIAKPFYKWADKKEFITKLIEIKENIKSNKNRACEILINFFSCEKDGSDFINEINKDKNNEELLETYLQVAINRIEMWASRDFSFCKSVFSCSAMLSFLLICLDTRIIRLNL